MNAQIEVSPNVHPANAPSTPVRIEIYDANLKLIVQEWVQGSEIRSYTVEPGVYGVRISSASGTVFDQSIRVEADKLEKCSPPLYSVSPHESQQWAYLTQSIAPAGGRLLTDERYSGVWMRLWRRSETGMSARWEVVSNPIEGPSQGRWHEDSVTYQFMTPDQGLYVIQVGGPKIRWKMVAVPSSTTIMVLVRPSPDPVAAVHPLDIVVSSNDAVSESLLTLLQRGDLSSAEDLVKQSRLAEQLLFQKYANADAAAVGGYFLLRLNDLKRMHDWSANLANSFGWMADGAVIDAWRLILAAKHADDSQTKNLGLAKERLLQAVERGFPIYNEGLRLLRDGLLLLSRHARGEDQQVSDALTQIGRYTAVADWSMTSTTFTGNAPDVPLEKSRKGMPKKRDALIYVFDVPVREVLRHASVTNEKFDLSSLAGDEAVEAESDSAAESMTSLDSVSSSKASISKTSAQSIISQPVYDEIVSSLRTQGSKR